MDTWPSLIAADTAGQLRFGVDAAAVRHEPGWSVLRSVKRLLNHAGPRTEVTLAGRNYRLADLLAGLSRSAEKRPAEPLERRPRAG